MKFQALPLAVVMLLGATDAKLRPKVLQVRNGQTLQDIQEKLESDSGVDYPIIESDQAVTENSHERKVRSPMVQSHGTYQSYCIFDDDQNNWCLISTGPMLTVGWEIKQYTVPYRSGSSALSGNYTIKLIPYLMTAISLQSAIVMDVLFSKEDIMTVQNNSQSIKVSVFYQMLFVTTGQICLGYGYDYTPIEIKVSTNYHAYDCYKTIIQDICKWDEAFLGKEAKWVDSCTKSPEENDIVLIDWQIQSGSQTVSLLGGTVADGEGCWQFANWTYWAPHIAKYASNLLSEADIPHYANEEDLDASVREMLSWLHN